MAYNETGFNDNRSSFEEHRTEASVIAEIAGNKTRVVTINGHPFSLVAGRDPDLIEDALDFPPRVKTTAHISSLASFRDYIVRHMTGLATRPVIFAEEGDSATFRAVFDYHANAENPNWGEDRALFSLEHDPRFCRLRHKFSDWLSQEQLIDLIEENESYVLEPSGADMLELAQNLEFNMKSKVVAKRSAQSGVKQLHFESDEGKDSTVVPETVRFGMPIFRGIRGNSGKLRAYDFEVRLRYRVRDGGVRFMLTPKNLDDVLLEAWQEIVEEVKSWDIADVFES